MTKVRFVFMEKEEEDGIVCRPSLAEMQTEKARGEARP